MRVLTVIAEQVLAPVPGGTGRYARQIVEALAGERPNDWRLRTATAWHSDLSPIVVAGVGGPHRLPIDGRVLSRVWERGLPPWPRGTTIHATTPLAPSTFGPSRLGLRGKRPVVVTVHDTVPWSHPETLTPRGVHWHQQMISRAVESAAALVVPTRVVGEELAAIFPAAAAKTNVIGHGVTAMPMPADPIGRRAALGLPERYLLSLATLEPRKGLDTLIQSIGRLRDSSVTLVLVGQTGWGGMDLPKLAAQAGVAPEQLVALGRIPDEDLAVVLGGATALVCPSLAEGFGLPVLEGFAAGIPVVCSDAPALVEVADGAALIVPRKDPEALTDALRRILTEEALRQELAAKGTARARDFTWQAAARRLWALHQSLV